LALAVNIHHSHLRLVTPVVSTLALALASTSSLALASAQALTRVLAPADTALADTTFADMTLLDMILLDMVLADMSLADMALADMALLLDMADKGHQPLLLHPQSPPHTEVQIQPRIFLPPMTLPWRPTLQHRFYL
jgi:hypothetical protein